MGPRKFLSVEDGGRGMTIKRGLENTKKATQADGQTEIIL